MSALIDLAHRLDFLAVLLGFVVLLTILMQTLMSFMWDRSLLFARGLRMLQLLDERAMGLLAVLALGVMLRSRFASSPMSHR